MFHSGETSTVTEFTQRTLDHSNKLNMMIDGDGEETIDILEVVNPLYDNDSEEQFFTNPLLEMREEEEEQQWNETINILASFYSSTENDDDDDVIVDVLNPLYEGSDKNYLLPEGQLEVDRFALLARIKTNVPLNIKNCWNGKSIHTVCITY
jgi:hypothetical protein